MRISDWSSDVCSSDLLPTQAAAQTIADKVKGGTSLAAAAKSAGLAVAGLSDLSQLQYAEKSSDAVAKAAFAAPRGGIAQIAKSPLGWHVVRVSNVTTTPAKTLAAAREEIVKILTDQKRSEEHTSELQSLMRISYAVFCLTKKKQKQ